MLRQREPEPTHDWEVYSIGNSPAKLVGWVQAATAKEACREMAQVSGNDVKELSPIFGDGLIGQAAAFAG